MIEFIFMLTRDDVTLTDAREVYASVAGTGLRHVGCKDVGLPREELAALMDDIRSHGHETWIEVVSETEEDTLKSARVAAEIRPDHLIGGTLIEPVQEILEGTGVKFWPYVGQIVGHPCLLRGTIEEIVADTERAAALGVDGINLLAYRYDGDVEALVRAVVGATDLPVICAGSVDSRRAHPGARRPRARGRSRSAPRLWMASWSAARSRPSCPAALEAAGAVVDEPRL